MKSSTKNWIKVLAPIGLVSLAILSWTSISQSQQAAPTAPGVTSAIAVLSPTGDNKVAGTVKFITVDGGLKVIADVTGLAPGKHGFHIHEWGDISDSAKGMATGGHYDPERTHTHALIDIEHPAAMPHHAGDMGNLDADASGHAHLEGTLMGLSLMANDPIVGRAVIVHAGEDTGAQPTGNAGGRVAQAVIGIADPGVVK